jgi:hypothetical protein
MPKFDIHLKDPKTGKIIVYQDDFDFYDSPVSTGKEWVNFMYTDGNYGCDCNRSNFMGIDELDCGDTIELIKIVDHDTGEISWPENNDGIEYDPKLVVQFPELNKSGFIMLDNQ